MVFAVKVQYSISSQSNKNKQNLLYISKFTFTPILCSANTQNINVTAL